MHVTSLRVKMDPFLVLDVLTETVAPLPDAVLRINVHDEIFEPDNYWSAPRAGGWLLAYANRPCVTCQCTHTSPTTSCGTTCHHRRCRSCLNAWHPFGLVRGVF